MRALLRGEGDCTGAPRIAAVWRGYCAYCTVRVPSMPAIRCPGTEQKNL